MTKDQGVKPSGTVRRSAQLWPRITQRQCGGASPPVGCSSWQHACTPATRVAGMLWGSLSRRRRWKQKQWKGKQLSVPSTSQQFSTTPDVMIERMEDLRPLLTNHHVVGTMLSALLNSFSPGKACREILLLFPCADEKAELGCDFEQMFKPRLTT